MKLLHLAALAGMSVPLSGCFFFYVPGSVVSRVGDVISGEHGNYCVGPNIKVGDKLALPNGGVGVVQSLNGTSHRCKEAGRPIRADVT